MGTHICTPITVFSKGVVVREIKDLEIRCIKLLENLFNLQLRGENEAQNYYKINIKYR